MLRACWMRSGSVGCHSLRATTSQDAKGVFDLKGWCVFGKSVGGGRRFETDRGGKGQQPQTLHYQGNHGPLSRQMAGSGWPRPPGIHLPGQTVRDSICHLWVLGSNPRHAVTAALGYMGNTRWHRGCHCAQDLVRMPARQSAITNRIWFHWGQNPILPRASC